ncbi:MAG: cytochrome c biogenesis protein CcsA [Planctomycetota bacterium]|nr:cytochrome c biogenesis protein CcsA [Planctomycetota bacterium]
MNRLQKLQGLYWIATIALMIVEVAMSIWYAPIESTMGPIQKIFYLHLPAAMNTFFAAFVVFAAGLGYVWTRDERWDLLADAAARVAVLFCTVVLCTGVIWAHEAWGRWWTWSPRLTFSLIMLLLYIVYLAMRSAIESPRRRAVVCAVYGVLAFLDVPLVYLSVKLLPDIHPSSIELEPAMAVTLAVWFIPISMICIGLIGGRYLLSAAAMEHGGDSAHPGVARNGLLRTGG